MNFRVWNTDGGDRDDARLIKAIDHQDAAERWAEWEDAQSADYLIVSGSPATVGVCEDSDGSEIRYFVVSGEPCPVYHARKTEAEPQR